MKTLALVLLLLPTALAAESKIKRSSMGGDLAVDNAPAGADLRTMGGDIRVKHATGDVVAKTMGGNVSIGYVDGSVDAGSMGGNVSVNVYGAAAGRSIEVRSMGGHIEVTLPANFSGQFDIELEQDDEPRERHRIISDFPLKVEESTKRSWFRKREVLNATGRSGSGANRVEITTIGGDIVIRKRAG